MELIRGLHNLRPRHRGCVATIGAFDGVHHGHRAVFAHLLEKSRELALPATVIVFEPLPREYLAPAEAPARLMSFGEKFRALQALGIDRVLRIKFNEPLRNMPAGAFIENVLVGGLAVKYIVVGDDLRFGRDRQGDYHLIKDYSADGGYEVMHTDTLGVDGERVSSTRIREALEASDFSLAEELLGRPYSITGKVIYGQQYGRQIGVPTANLELHRLRAPLTGVYTVEVLGVTDQPLPGVANVGTRPTVGDLTKAILEVHLLDFDEDIYGRRIEVIFRHKIREEKKFSSLEDLTANISADIDSGRHYFGIGTSAG